MNFLTYFLAKHIFAYHLFNKKISDLSGYAHENSWAQFLKTPMPTKCSTYSGVHLEQRTLL